MPGTLEPNLPTENISRLEQLKFDQDPLNANSVVIKNKINESVLPDGAATESTQSLSYLQAKEFYSKATFDAFSRLRVSQPTTLFECTFSHDEQAELFTSSSASGGNISWNSNYMSILLNTTTTSGSSIGYSTRRYIYYHPGKSNEVIITGSFNSLDNNVTKMLGQFDNANGFFWKMKNGLVYVGFRSSTTGSIVDTEKVQAEWDDPMDGTGASGITVNWTKQQIFILNYQWLGSGAVKFYLSIDGKLHLVHSFKNANVLTRPYSQTAVLPLRFTQSSDATLGATPTPMHITCVEVSAEGGFNPEGVPRTINTGTGAAKAIAGTTMVPIISYRKNSSHTKKPINIMDLSLLPSADDFLITIIENGTLTGPSWTANGGYIEYDTAATAISGGNYKTSFWIAGANNTAMNYQNSEIFKQKNFDLGCDYDGANSDIMSIVAQSASGAATMRASMNLREYT